MSEFYTGYNFFNGDDIDGDCSILESILEQVEFYSGTERKKMLHVNHKIGGSMLYGLTWRAFLKRDKKTGEIITRKKDLATGLYYTKIMTDYPDLQQVFYEFGQLYFPDFEFNQVQMNKNFKCPPHKDSQNVGESILISIGDFKDGNTCIEKNPIAGPIVVNSHNQPIKFNGSKYTHWVEPWLGGDRYSLVFFNRFKKKLM